MGYAAEHLQHPDPIYTPCCSPSLSWGAPSSGRSTIWLRLGSSFSYRTRCSTRTSADKWFLSQEEVPALVVLCARGLLVWVQLLWHGISTQQETMRPWRW